MDPAQLQPLGGDDDIGAFQQGNAITRWALARYLVGRALAVYVSRALFVVALAVFGLAALMFWLHVGWLGILIGLAGLSILVLRALLAAVKRRMTVAGSDAQIDHRLRALVSATGGDVARELRRIGLPSRSWTLPLLVVRLTGRRRAETAERLRSFDVERVVPPARLDELHLLMRANAGRGGPFG
jgi:hypothetical protein